MKELIFIQRELNSYVREFETLMIQLDKCFHYSIQNNEVYNMFFLINFILFVRVSYLKSAYF